jgi:hypothetical protein
VQQVLQSAPVRHPALNLLHEILRNVDRNTTSVCATVQDIILMLLTGPTGQAILAHAPGPPQAQRAKNRRPKMRRFNSQPVRDIYRRFRINMLHARMLTLSTCLAQENSFALARKLLIALWRYVRIGELPAGVALHPAHENTDARDLGQHQEHRMCALARRRI